MARPTMIRSLIVTLLLVAVVGSAHAGSYKRFKECKRTHLVHFDGTIVDAAIATAEATGELSTLVDLVVAAGLVDALSAPGNLTVFAPTNAAFGALPDEIVDAISGDLLVDVLTYHVVGKKVDPRSTYRKRRAKVIPSLQGQKLFVHQVNGQPQVNNSAVDCQGVRTDNGLVWLIDSVLLPQVVN